jgi:hypothetical protein
MRALEQVSDRDSSVFLEVSEDANREAFIEAERACCSASSMRRPSGDAARELGKAKASTTFLEPIRTTAK